MEKDNKIKGRAGRTPMSEFEKNLIIKTVRKYLIGTHQEFQIMYRIECNRLPKDKKRMLITSPALSTVVKWFHALDIKKEKVNDSQSRYVYKSDNPNDSEFDSELREFVLSLLDQASEEQIYILKSSYRCDELSENSFLLWTKQGEEKRIAEIIYREFEVAELCHIQIIPGYGCVEFRTLPDSYGFTSDLLKKLKYYLLYEILQYGKESLLSDLELDYVLDYIL